MTTSLYLFASVSLLLVWCCAGAEIRDKRSESAVDSDNNSCKPGSTWFDGCNNCFCSEHGLPGCTLKACITLPQVDVQDVKVVAEETLDKKCEPGTKWQEDCNSCFCSQNGVSACTEIGCLSI